MKIVKKNCLAAQMSQIKTYDLLAQEIAILKLLVRLIRIKTTFLGSPERLEAA